VDYDPEIRNHTWFLKNLPADLMDADNVSNQYEEPDQPMQTMDQIMQILTEATIPPACSRSINVLADGLDMDMDDLESILMLTAVVRSCMQCECKILDPPETITLYYKDLFGPSSPSSFSLDESRVDDIEQVSHEENDLFTRPFTMEEVLVALF
jgi:hypothetical protein